MTATYPGSVPTLAHHKTNATAQYNDHPTHHRELAEELNAVMVELGADPSGAGQTSVANAIAYLNSLSHAHPIGEDSASLSLSDFGTPENASDALDAAFDEIASVGGGSLIIPPGEWVIDAPVVANIGTASRHVRIIGCGSASRFVLDGLGNGVHAIEIANLDDGLLSVEGICVVGDPELDGADGDCASVFHLHDVSVADFDRCSFWGVGTNGDAGEHGNIYASQNVDLRVRNSIFKGCADQGVGGVGLISAETYIGMVVENVRFHDHGTLNGVFHSKTPQFTNHAWVGASTPAQEGTVTGPNARIYIRNLFCDEGTSWMVAVASNSAISNLPELHVDGLSGWGGLGGNVTASRVDHVTLKNIIGRMYIPSGGAGLKLAQLAGVGEAELIRVRGQTGINTITADANCGTLTIHDNCTYGTLTSSATTDREPAYDAL